MIVVYFRSINYQYIYLFSPPPSLLVDTVKKGWKGMRIEENKVSDSSDDFNYESSENNKGRQRGRLRLRKVNERRF